MKIKFPRHLIFSVLALLLAGPAVVARGSDAAPTQYSFTGQYTSEDWGSYRYLPFFVPEGTTIIKVKYSYAERDGGNAILDIGIHDPEKYRGWSATTKAEFTVSESRELTTDSYLPGEIPAGEWRIELGIPTIDPITGFLARLYGINVPKRSAVVTYNVEIELSDQPVGEPFTAPLKRDVVLNNQPGWYYGELHCHSTHSDGAYPLEAVYDYAHGLGLDFIATTEHNSISHYSYIGEMQKKYDDMLILYGSEYTSYIGHANVYNMNGIYDYHATNPDYDINQVIDEIHAGGGYFSPNHPQSFLKAGIPYLIEDTDWSKVDFYEVVNGKTRMFKVIPNPINVKAILKWDRLLREGHRITAIGGSDDHEAGHGSTPVTAHIGIPTTVVYAEGLSTRGILDGLAAGHVYILDEGKESGLAIEFTASGAGREAMMGDLIEAPEIEFKVRIKNAQMKTLVLIENGLPLTLPITGDDYELSFKRKPRQSGYIRLKVRTGPFDEIITNPIYYGP